MDIVLLLFYLFALVATAAALGVILLRNPVHAALSLVLTFVTVAAIWALVKAEFLAMVLIVVYVGAVMVLFLFVVMMLEIKTDPLREGFARYLPVGLVVAAVMAFELLAVLGAKYFTDARYVPRDVQPDNYSNTAEVGLVLFQRYAIPFEVASIILLVAAVAAVALTLRKRSGVRVQDPSQQVLVQRNDRIELISMAADKRPANGANSSQ
jgi:NADH-quinone oxidoreductase subunit J